MGGTQVENENSEIRNHAGSSEQAQGHFSLQLNEATQKRLEDSQPVNSDEIPLFALTLRSHYDSLDWTLRSQMLF